MNKEFKGYWETDCDGCSGKNMPYMITFNLWKKIFNGDDFLCLFCVEKRLGRKLKKQDFLKADTLPINNGVFGFKWQDWVNKNAI